MNREFIIGIQIMDSIIYIVLITIRFGT